MNEQREHRFIVHGMTCDHCAHKVKTAAAGVPGVLEAAVNWKSGIAVVASGSELDTGRITTAIGYAGYSAELESHPAAQPVFVKTHDDAPAADDYQTEADLIVIGGGSAGFAAAIRGHELGAQVIMLNAGVLGGTCVNVGCVPSKTLIRAAEAHHRASEQRFSGIHSQSRVSSFAAVIRDKDKLVASLRQVKYADVLAAYENVQLVEGRARFITNQLMEVEGRRIYAPRIVVATGSRPWIPPIPGLSEAEPLTSTTAFELDKLPASVIVMGGRYIALECAQMLARLGAKVTILQRSDHLLPDEDEDITEALAGYLGSEGIAVETSVRMKRVIRDIRQIEVHTEVNGNARTFCAERILAATGRRPITEDMGLESIGVELSEDGLIIVDAHGQTSATGVYAAGDVIGEPVYVYTAAYEGRLAAENALNGAQLKRDYSVLPWVIFTDPQVSGVGLNEKEAASQGIEVDVAKLDLEQVPKALAARDTRGFIKLIKQRGGDRLLGARILAPEGGEQVMEAALAIRYGIGVSDIAAMFHPYLTGSEAVKLCAQAFHRDVKKLSCCSA